MSEKKGKITLSGLSKGSSSSNNSFMSASFHFSPEVEEISFVPPPRSETPSSCGSSPPSPKPNSGDVSPLKEYLLKEKHKWTNKWDKKSLSLDLDIKGKIKTAIEDKTKSILSNFIPEEGVIHSSQSECNLATRVFSPISTEDHSSSSGSGKGDNKSKNNSDGSQETLDGEPDIFKTAYGENDEVEEIGLDMTDYNPDAEDREETNMIEQMATFNIPPEDLQEFFDGMPTLYQPISLISGVRVIPFELVVDESVASSLSARNISQGTQGEVVHPRELSIFTLIINILSDIVYNSWTKYLFALGTACYMLPMGPVAPFVWFVLGALTIIVIYSGVSAIPASDTNKQTVDNMKQFTLSSFNHISTPMIKELSLPAKCQGWMTQLEGHYDVDVVHFRQTKVVYVKIDNHNMYLSYPNPKQRIPKRRLWNDPVIDRPYIFDKIKVYDISRATIGIVPDGLPRKRAWNKKYPIAITLPKHSVYHTVTPQRNFEATDNSHKKEHTAGGAVNYNAYNADISVQTESTQPEKEMKEISRKDCGLLTIYLFARCDREKDDWFRRFTAAAKRKTTSRSFLPKSAPNPLKEYRDFMFRVCPNLTPAANTNVSDGFDNISLPGDTFVSKRPDASKAPGSKSPSSSKKTTPEKGSPLTRSSMQSEIENILTVPQSPSFLNALMGRLFYDFLKSSYGKQEIQKLIDKKLFYMKKPPFIEDIHVSQLSLGNSLPIILRASPPVIDHQGLWVDFDLIYDGNFHVSLETRVNLLKLMTKKPTGKEHEKEPEPSCFSGSKNKGSKNATTSSPPNSGPARRSHIFDSDADDSGESSEDENDVELNKLLTYSSHGDHNADPGGPSKGAKFIEKLVNTDIIMNRSIVKKIVNNVAATPLVLAVELKGLFGTLTCNVPAPPNDRLWLGFRTNPDLQLVAKPLKFGETNINIAQVTEWIRRKLLLEFQRAIVCPNMVDLSIPFMEWGLPK